VRISRRGARASRARRRRGRARRASMSRREMPSAVVQSVCHTMYTTYLYTHHSKISSAIKRLISLYLGFTINICIHESAVARARRDVARTPLARRTRARARDTRANARVRSSSVRARASAPLAKESDRETRNRCRCRWCCHAIALATL
jgi:hypothetical protein